MTSWVTVQWQNTSHRIRTTPFWQAIKMSHVCASWHLQTIPSGVRTWSHMTDSVRLVNGRIAKAMRECAVRWLLLLSHRASAAAGAAGDSMTGTRCNSSSSSSSCGLHCRLRMNPIVLGIGVRSRTDEVRPTLSLQARLFIVIIISRYGYLCRSFSVHQGTSHRRHFHVRSCLRLHGQCEIARTVGCCGWRGW